MSVPFSTTPAEHPRGCGEQQYVLAVELGESGPSPCAGSSSRRCAARSATWDHPRGRGEQFQSPMMSAVRQQAGEEAAKTWRTIGQDDDGHQSASSMSEPSSSA